MRSILAMLVVFMPAALAWGGPKAITACGRLEKSGAYVLQSDINSPGTCFGVTADNVTLDLNGHTISYGGGDVTGEKPAYGVVAYACWDKTSDPAFCGNASFHNLTIKNGTIIQNENASPHSHAVRVGQGASKALHVEDVKITISAPSSSAIYSLYGSGAVVIRNVEINDRVKEVANRHQIEGAAVRIPGIVNPVGPDKISGLKIVGTPQGGIVDRNPGTVFEHNDILLTGTYTNDFGIYLWGDGQVARDNVINGQGRGIQLAYSRGMRATHNAINIFENPVNEEYNGCQRSGTFGIQFEEGSREGLVTENTVTVIADGCDARALRHTDVPANNKNLSTHNHYKAVRMKGTQAKAIAASFSNAKDVLVEDDVLEADTFNIEVDWSGSKNVVLRKVRIVKGSNPAPDYATFYLWPGSENQRVPNEAHLTVIDATFENGASPDLFKMYPIGFEKWAQSAEYFIQWTQQFRVVDAAGTPIAGANVTVTDQNGKQSFQGTTDVQGVTQPVPLTEFRRYNIPAGISKESFTYQVRAEKEGKKAEIAVAATKAATVQIKLE